MTVIKQGLALDFTTVTVPSKWLYSYFPTMSLKLSSDELTLLPQGTGYGLLIGLGVAFCGVILAAVKVQKAYLSEDSGTSEMFMVANRSVGTGLTASAVFSSWMWINETVLSAAMCYRFGLAVPLVRILSYFQDSDCTESC